MSKEELLAILDDITITADNVPNWRNLKELLYALIMELKKDEGE